METALLRVTFVAPCSAFLCELPLSGAQVIPLGCEASLRVQLHERQGGGAHHDATHTHTYLDGEKVGLEAP